MLKNSNRLGSRVVYGLIAGAVLVAGGLVSSPAQAATPEMEAARAGVRLLTPELQQELGKQADQEAADTGVATVSCANVALLALGNMRYVSTESGYTGRNKYMLRARATSIGTWEKYTYCHNSLGYYTLKSNANNLYVSTETSYTSLDYGMLRARSASIGATEKYGIGVNGAAYWFQSKANSRWVLAAIGYGGAYNGELLAMSTAAPPDTIAAEKFYRPLL